MKKFYLTTAIAYASSKPHIGNTYEIILADAIARYKRLQGFDVIFQTGTDEHGQKIQNKASEANMSEKDYVDSVSKEIKRIWDLTGSSYTRFIRTTDNEHKKKVSEIFNKLYSQGDIYKGHYKGMYCTPCESFFTESQLIDNKCPDCGREVEMAEEEAYFFRLSKYQKRLEKYMDEHPDFIQPLSRKNEMINNFLKPGLQDLCVSRTSFDWGIKVEGDQSHVVYVWLDALVNYITFAGYEVDLENTEFNKVWPADLQIVGKDIIRFHSIYWPIFLMALDLPLPKVIYGHPWLKIGNEKMSKSKGNVLYADDLIEEYGLDAIRYYVLREISFANDGNITKELLTETINTDLANILGNLVQRTISMCNKYFNGVIENKNVTTDLDDNFILLINELKETTDKEIDNLSVSNAISSIFKVLKASNKFIDETMPWVLAKDENSKDRLMTVLYELLESIRVCGLLLSPFIPTTSSKIVTQLNNTCSDFKFIKNNNYKVGTPEILFQRIEK